MGSVVGMLAGGSRFRIGGLILCWYYGGRAGGSMMWDGDVKLIFSSAGAFTIGTVRGSGHVLRLVRAVAHDYNIHQSKLLVGS